MLIRSKGRESYGFMRFALHVDDFKQIVRVEVIRGPAPDARERRLIQKFLQAKRPDLPLSSEVHTGWGFESAIDIRA